MTFDYVDWFNKDKKESKVETKKNVAAQLDKSAPIVSKQNGTITNMTRIVSPKVVNKMNMTVLNRILNDSVKAAPSNQTRKGIVPKKIKKV